MVTNGGNSTQPPAVLFSAGLDSAVLLAAALTGGPAHPVYIRTGLAITVLAYLLTLLFGATYWRWLGYV